MMSFSRRLACKSFPFGGQLAAPSSSRPAGRCGRAGSRVGARARKRSELEKMSSRNQTFPMARPLATSVQAATMALVGLNALWAQSRCGWPPGELAIPPGWPIRSDKACGMRAYGSGRWRDTQPSAKCLLQPARLAVKTASCVLARQQPRAEESSGEPLECLERNTRPAGGSGGPDRKAFRATSGSPAKSDGLIGNNLAERRHCVACSSSNAPPMRPATVQLFVYRQTVLPPARLATVRRAPKRALTCYNCKPGAVGPLASLQLNGDRFARSVTRHCFVSMDEKSSTQMVGRSIARRLGRLFSNALAVRLPAPERTSKSSLSPFQVQRANVPPPARTLPLEPPLVRPERPAASSKNNLAFDRPRPAPVSDDGRRAELSLLPARLPARLEAEGAMEAQSIASSAKRIRCLQTECAQPAVRPSGHGWRLSKVFAGSREHEDNPALHRRAKPSFCSANLLPFCLASRAT